MKKFLDYDWLREMQFLGNMVQKKLQLQLYFIRLLVTYVIK